MRPIILHGHQRPITRLCYNRDGDLIFTAAKNTVVNVWFSANGERLGSFSGHDGVIWWLDPDWRTENLLTASGDYHGKLWDISTGKCLSDYEAQAPVRTCGISFCGNLCFLTTDEARVDGKSKKCEIIVLDKRDPSHSSGNPRYRNMSFSASVKIHASTNSPVRVKPDHLMQTKVTTNASHMDSKLSSSPVGATRCQLRVLAICDQFDKKRSKPKPVAITARLHHTVKHCCWENHTILRHQLTDIHKIVVIARA
ncbi:unnamed protein product [Echinostoma caproni]|uniref:Serine-threonine kinase receptor-associated protein n=1 Tax=Echinostoma caproni TaxID=27848 RepID=A0A183AMS3_9TREM|nr:unnamed protein product [Echinostoma caproni]